MADFTPNERTDKPNASASERRDGGEKDGRVEPQGETQNTATDLPTTPGTEIETPEEGAARVTGQQEVPDELRGLSQPSDVPLPASVAEKLQNG